MSRVMKAIRWAPLVPHASFLALRVKLAARKQSMASLAKVGAPAPAQNGARPHPETVVRAVRLGTTLGPWKAKCLLRSLVAGRMLVRYGYPTQVVIGVPDNERPDDAWRAHAWVEVPSLRPDGRGFGEIARIVP